MPEQVQEIEELRSRYETLRDKKTKAETLLHSANKELERLKAEAHAQYGTSDLAELEAKLTQMEDENLKLRKEYQKLLDKIETGLRDVEDTN